MMQEINFVSKGYRTSNRKHHKKLFKRILNLQVALSYLQFTNDVKTTFMCLIFPEKEMMWRDWRRYKGYKVIKNNYNKKDIKDIMYLKMHQWV